MPRKNNSIRPGMRVEGSRLVVIEYVGNNKFNHKMWRCQCDCGNEIVTETNRLTTGKTRSCGCLKNEGNNRKHGKCYTRLYRIYEKMKERCYCESNPRYSDYGGRGIRVCDEWIGENGFENFYNWAMANGYSDSLTIDRIENDGNYEPGNCRWADTRTQGRNTRRNVYLTVDGIKKTVAEWSEETGIPYYTILQRVQRLGWSHKEAITREVGNGRV